MIIMYLHTDPLLLSGSQRILQKKLGEGGFGTVYLSSLNGTFVAVKQLKLDKNADVDHMNEIKALRYAIYVFTIFGLTVTCNVK